MTQEEFFARYIIDYQNDRLGSGAFGTVYKAYDAVSNIWRAVKISVVRYVDEKKISLIDEFDLIKKISEHTNIANYLHAYQFNTHAGLHDFIIMQYYEAGNLRDVMNTKQLSYAHIDHLLKGILEGIRCLHSHHVIHRDLKPTNILIAKDIKGNYVPKITDFGLSKFVNLDDSHISSSFGGGTLEYSSPEQLLGKDLLPNTDLWAFGVIAFELLSGKKFFDLPSQSVPADVKRKLIFEKIAHGALPVIEKNIPKHWADAITMCLNYDNTSRVASAETILHLVQGEQEETELLIGKKEMAEYQSAMRTGNLSLLQSFLTSFPNSTLHTNVANKIKSLQRSAKDIFDDDTEVIPNGNKPTEADTKSFQEAQRLHNVPALRDYLSRFPDGLHVVDAKELIKIIRGKKVTKTAMYVVASSLLAIVGFFALGPILKGTSLAYDYRVYKQQGLYGYIAPTGDTLTSAVFTRAEPFVDGIALAYKKDTLYRVTIDGTMTADIVSIPPAHLYLSDSLIMSADLTTLYNLVVPYTSDPLISTVHSRIKTLENHAEAEAYAQIRNSNDIATMEKFIASHPKSRHLPDLKKKIDTQVKNLRNKSEKELFELAKASNSKTLVDAYLDKYPQGSYHVEVNILRNAINVLESKVAWYEAKVTNSVERLTEYIRQYPNSDFIDDAKASITQLHNEKQQIIKKQKWKDAKNSGNITQINVFISNYPNSPYLSEARNELKSLKEKAEKITSTPATMEKKSPVDERCKVILHLFEHAFKSIPGGTYTSSANIVRQIAPFHIGIYEVTREQFNTVSNTTSAYFTDKQNLPVENISYNDVKVFLDKLNNLACNDYFYRLPTVAEWEYAALGGSVNLLIKNKTLMFYYENNSTFKVI